MELSRRDDLESLGYMLIYFYLGTLSWQDISGLNNTNESIKQLKMNILHNNKLPPVIINYMNYVRSLEFEETPEYAFLIEKFQREIRQI